MKEEALELADELKDVADVLGSNNIEATVIGKGADMIRKLVAELDKQGEPVAWFEQDEKMKSVWYQCDKDDPSAIPLYTAPQTKPLSDEEIIKLTEGKGNQFVDMSHDELIDFARAIEERILGK